MVQKEKKPVPPPTVDSIMRECETETRKGLGRKRLSAAARQYWDDNHRLSIQTNLAKGADWLVDRKKTLPVSRKLGKVAATLTSGGIVLLWAAKAAHVAVKGDPGCPGLGSGGYCDF